MKNLIVGPSLLFITLLVPGWFNTAILSDQHPGEALAEARCQVLDKAASKLNITLDLFGDTRKTKVDNIKALLWIDPERPESARLVASLEPRVSQLFGNFEENPLLIGMLANYLDKELTFRSLSVVKREGSERYKVLGEVTSGKKKYPTDFNISLQQVGSQQSRFIAKVQSDNFEKVIGMPGSAQGDFDLIFKVNPVLGKDRCVL
jgi:hypothetical protein